MSDPTKPKFTRGIRIKPDNLPLENVNGEIKVDSVDNKIKTTLGGSAKEILTNDQVQTLTNKTIDVDNNTVSNIEVDNLKAGVLNTDLSTGSPTDTEIPSAKAVRDYVDAKTDAQNEASEISFDPAGTIVATNVQDMGEELDGDIQGHINEVTGAHAASAIASTPSGNLAATDVQGALNELQSDVDTRALDSALTDHINDATDAHDASAISVIPSGNLAADDVQEALVELQVDIDDINVELPDFVKGPASTGDDFVPVFDGTSGKLLKTSAVSIDHTNNLISASAGASNLGGTQIVGGKITGIGGTLLLDGSGSTGTVQVDKKLSVPNKLTTGGTEDSTSTGSNVTLPNPNAGYIRLKNSGLVSIDMIDATLSNGQVLIISNQTGNPVTINNSTGATSANQILTGTGGPLTLLNEASILLRYDGGTTSKWTIVGGSGSGGGQSLDTIFQLTGMDFSQWVSGNNATFLGGGTLAGTFASETAAPLNGISSYKYTQTASPGSLNDYVASPVQEVPLRFRGQTNTVVFPFTYNGSNNDIVPVMYDVTNSAIIFGSVNNDGYALLGTNGGVKNYQANFTIPLSCTQVRFGFQVKAFSASAVLQFDDIEVGKDAVINVPMPENQYFEAINSPNGFASSWIQNIRFSSMNSTGISGILRYVDSPTLGAYWEALKPCAVNFQLTGAYFASTQVATILKNQVNSSESGTLLSKVDGLTDMRFNLSSNFSLNTGDKISIRYGTTVTRNNGEVLRITATATSDNIISPTESFSTDTAQLTYAPSSTYTLSTLANAPVGTYITFTYAANTNTRTQTTTRPTQTDADMNVNGMQIFARAYNATSTAAQPAVFAIQIGKGLKGRSLDLYKSAAKTIAGGVKFLLSGTTGQLGLYAEIYDENTGVYYLDAGYMSDANRTSVVFQFNDLSTQASGYLVINASKSPVLCGVPALQIRTATIKDIKASGTGGGTATAGAYQTRTLNTIDDPTGIVTSLTGNQFTLPAGEYYIEAKSNGAAVAQHKIKIRNISDNSDSIVGISAFTASATTYTTLATLVGKITISSTKVFELQHRVGSTKSSDGFGVASSFGDSEVHSVVKITKVK